MDIKDLITKDQIQATLIIDKHYGHRRIALKLSKNKKKILRIMKKYNIVPLKHKHKKLIKKDDLKKQDTLIPNYIKDICPTHPNVVWSSDFTYIKYNNTFVFMCTVMDIFTREIIGVSISNFHNEKLVIDALIRALINRGVPALYLHSDQGSEYTGNK